MGLDTSHDCWHGPYSSFGDFRAALAKAAGMPPLKRMEGFGGPLGVRPIKWETLKPDAIHELLNHSDCDGIIPWESCAAIADRMEQLLPDMGDWSDETQQFIDGLRLAARRKENVVFH